MKNPVVDITNCEREPIHIPGKIQSQGFLIALNKADATIQYASENIKEKTGLEAEHILGNTFDWFLQKGRITLQSLSASQILTYHATTNFDAINPVLTEVHGVPFYLIVHASGKNRLLCEFEPCHPTIETELHRMVGVSVSKILEGRTVKAVLQNAAKQVRDIIGYDRVMIYKFWEDDHGEVIAEDKAEHIEPFMGLHYPASDIPKQARNLYLTNLTRIIADIHSPTSDIIGAGAADSNATAQLDLTHSTLRAVSPIHIQYLNNMGVAASFSVSLVSHNKLWGLIACHNYSPKFIEYRAREAAKLLGQILSSSVEYRDDEETKEAARQFRQSVDAVAKEMQQAEDIAQAFANAREGVLKVTSASGLAIMFEDQLFTLGQTPAETQIRDIIDWLKQHVNSSIFHTDRFSDLYAPAMHYTEVASGILVCMLSKELGEYIMWFKPELVKMVNWAGNPEKPVEANANGVAMLSPRNSFAVWSEQVRNTSAPWSKAEISAVLKLREDVAYIINLKANQIRQLNERLKEAYDELDTFSFTISHDLKTPVTSIKNYAEIIMEEYPDLDEELVRMLKRILKSTDKMNLLIKEVLSYSRISRKELEVEEINMSLMIGDIINELQAAYKNSQTEFVLKDIVNLKADKTMMLQVFTNVISNAVKYSQRSNPPQVIIESLQNENEILYKISDNGIGIDMSFGSQIFEIFKRLDNVQQFEGSGVGLSIVKRIMEKHSAKIWYESELNQGTTFYLSFVNNK